MVKATASDAQPPSNTFTMLEAKKPMSMKPNTAVMATATHSRHFQMRVMTTNSSTVVTSMLPVTEMP
ncbi:hypothetical protein X773_04900 [Mesorhizobium sp. LSJC285A00]|nr:hypothetical protein X773_04900 [Mesorhizobium sp. LSJC285A00]